MVRSKGFTGFGLPDDGFVLASAVVASATMALGCLQGSGGD